MFPIDLVLNQVMCRVGHRSGLWEANLVVVDVVSLNKKSWTGMEINHCLFVCQGQQISKLNHSEVAEDINKLVFLF